MAPLPPLRLRPRLPLRLAPPTSAPPTPDCAPPSAPAPPGRAKEFIDGLELSDIPLKDKHFDGKAESRQIQREVHTIAQAMGRMYAEQLKDYADTTQILEHVTARAKTQQASIAANTRDIGTVNDRLEIYKTHADYTIEAGNEPSLETLELLVTNTAAQLGSIDSALTSLVTRVNAQTPRPASSPLVPDDEPMPAVNTLDTRMSGMESLLQQLVTNMAKRAHSPDPADNARNVRSRVTDPEPAPVFVPAAATLPLLSPFPRLLPLRRPSSVPPGPLPLSQSPPPQSLLLTAPNVVAPIAPAPVLAGANPPPPPLPAFDPTKEACLGPVAWGRNITGKRLR
ncbi:hypothetical protein C8F04DRAFT_1174798 [Mycena alexandri]|uniref:Uncharacterized protein n=1 Tax=Mycena alexandri TaxID=1745969 RepID=A0AAD6TFE6_9AGAR|nr:hypothetical protein C8F04DRAFT_1174798 [Mycena alexandri]